MGSQLGRGSGDRGSASRVIHVDHFALEGIDDFDAGLAADHPSSEVVPQAVLFAAEVDVTVDIATGPWRGNVGVVPTLIARAAFDPNGAAAFVCGPEAMMRFSAEALLERGVDRDRIYVSMERNMKCAVGHCGHCQLGPDFVCRDGPVFSYAYVEHAFRIREL